MHPPLALRDSRENDYTHGWEIAEPLALGEATAVDPPPELEIAYRSEVPIRERPHDDSVAALGCAGTLNAMASSTMGMQSPAHMMF